MVIPLVKKMRANFVFLILLFLCHPIVDGANVHDSVVVILDPLATSSPPCWHVSTRENQGSNFKYSILLADA
ncbi:hypothetical protein BKA70DRAFT_736731 [Coprinopsis sp. MPI-PUGE-AT-0042]|nr:hypothetical protein BKA70DRAFT_736731 [Coprinopsis sp. MPI-PUGE-AT-0042]